VLTYVLPLRTDDTEDVSELAAYLREVADHVDDVLVVDGSPTHTVEQHRALLDSRIRVVPPEEVTLMGKVGNVLTGLAHARHDKVVIADDDVRYTAAQLQELAARLDAAEVVRPQNYFNPRPWHARVDTARTLLARTTGGDWPGTLGVCRSFVQRAGGYSGDVLFENLELVRTVRAHGGREDVALDLLVARRPPTTRHFLRQQVRQAYDEFARPVRLVFSLSVLPLFVERLMRRRWGSIAAGTAAITLAAESGRRRAGGRAVFPVSSVLLAAPWMLWRSVCSWAAVGAYLRGGARYRGTRIRRAATPRRVLRRAARNAA
jgi:hypothetical protein